MRETVKLAIENGVKIGAHPGLPDLNGFGRREMKITPKKDTTWSFIKSVRLNGFLTTFGETDATCKTSWSFIQYGCKRCKTCRGDSSSSL